MSTWNVLRGGVLRPTLLTTLRSGNPGAGVSPLVNVSSPNRRRKATNAASSSVLIAQDEHAVLGEQVLEPVGVRGVEVVYRQPGHFGTDGIECFVLHLPPSTPSNSREMRHLARSHDADPAELDRPAACGTLRAWT